MGMFDRLTTMFNPDSVFKKEDGSLTPLNDAVVLFYDRLQMLAWMTRTVDSLHVTN